MLSSIGRAAVRRVAAKHPSPGRAVLSIRRAGGQRNETTTYVLQSQLSVCRTYATTTATKTTTKKAATAKASTKTKPTVKKSVSRAATKTTKTPVKKPAKKLATKTKAKPKRKVLTEEQQEKLALQISKRKEKAAARKTKEKSKAASVKSRLVVQELKAAALETPKRKPETSWTVFVAQTSEVKVDYKERFQFISDKFKVLSAEEKENLSHIAAQNAALNKVALTQWVESHTPDQILKANQARLRLGKIFSKSYPKIHDARIPTRAGSSYIRFFVEKRQAPEFDGVPPKEAAKSVAEYWKSMSEAERKPYVDSFVAHQRRYEEEYRTVFNRDPPSTIAQKKTL